MITPSPKLPRSIGAASLLIGTGLALAFVPSAQAGDYTVRYCPPGAPLQDFKLVLRGVSGSGGCVPGSGGLQVKMDPTGPTGGVLAGLTAPVPPGIFPVYLKARGSMQLNATPEPGMIGGFTYDECLSTFEDGCENGQIKPLSVDRPIPRDVELALTVRCEQVPNKPCVNNSGQVTASQFDVTFRDDTPPTGTATPTALALGADGTPVRGTQVVPYSAADTSGSGVKRIEARFDGQTVASTADQCASPYASMQPCPASAAGDLSIDTSRAADSTHEVKIVAVDASGNEAVLATTTTVTQNGANVGPGSDPAVRGAANGSYAADNAKIAAWWPATARSASKSTTVKRRCKSSKAYRRKHKVACVGRPPQSKLRVSYSEKKQNLVRGRLTTPNGDAVSSATVRVVATPSINGAPSSVATTAITDGSGRFKASVPTASGSATYSVQWAARVRDTVPAASAKLTRSVRATSSIALAPGRVVYRRQRLVLSGKLRGTTGTPKGTAVLVQINAGYGWRALTTVRARPSGRWTAPYRVLPQLRGPYRFRAVIRPSAAYAYASGASGTVRVRVR